MRDAIAVLNAGSSSLKFSLFLAGGSELEADVRGQIERIHTAPRFVAKRSDGTIVAEHAWPEGTKLDMAAALRHLVEFLERERAGLRVVAVGHRVAHGGREHRGPARLDAAVLAGLDALVPLAPLHQPHHLAAVRAVLAARPELPQVACFDTSFHRDMPDVAQRFAIPAELHDAGVQRYGFHGLSYEYIASVLPRYDARAAAGKSVVLHLGSGSSMCAMQACRSVATTMGFTGLDGLPMGTRCGALDPGVLLYLMDERKMGVREIERLLYTQSGLLGISGISSDMRTLLASDDPRAELAIEVYCCGIARELGSLAAALGGLDALVFTGGIGENAAPIRERVCRSAAWLGVDLDAAANARNSARIHNPGNRVSSWTIPTNEELVIARHTRRVLEQGSRRT